MKHTQIRVTKETRDRLNIQRAKYTGRLCKFVSVDRFIAALCRIPVEDIPEQETL